MVDDCFERRGWKGHCRGMDSSVSLGSRPQKKALSRQQENGVVLRERALPYRRGCLEDAERKTVSVSRGRGRMSPEKSGRNEVPSLRPMALTFSGMDCDRTEASVGLNWEVQDSRRCSEPLVPRHPDDDRNSAPTRQLCLILSVPPLFLLLFLLPLPPFLSQRFPASGRGMTVTGHPQHG